jgi:ATP synthase protein I
LKSNALLSRLSLAGLELGVGVGLGVFGGMYLDRKLDTGPWLMLAGMVLGVASGFYNLYRLAVASEEESGNPPGENERE